MITGICAVSGFWRIALQIARPSPSGSITSSTTTSTPPRAMQARMSAAEPAGIGSRPNRRR